MASDGPGKYRERKNRSSKPYERPKGIIRRVTDSFTGLFSASWLSGWMGGEEEEESGEPQPGPSQASTLTPPGESFIFAQTVTPRRSFRPFYPEEGETESNSQAPLGVNEGASTSSGIRMSMTATPTVGISTSRSVQPNVEPSGSSMGGRRLPIISSTPSTMFVPRSKGQMDPRPLPLLTTSTPACDDGSEMSESSADTGVDASVIPRPDERDYQREILQLDEESLQTLRDSLTKPVPSSPMAQPATTLPSLDETRKRQRDLEPDHSSIRAEGSVSSKSLFSEAGSMSHGQPQPSALASKRPRFNVSTYGSPIMSDRSVLSDSTFKASPFYPGKTMYGGASAYRSRRLQVRSSQQVPRAQVKPKAPAQSMDDGGLSQAARRILESLEQMSTPISDAKRIPTPTPGHRGSFLDSSYTTAFHRHRPTPRPSAPPSNRLMTPSKVTHQENLSATLLNSTSHMLDSSIHKRSIGTGTKREEACQTVPEFKSPEQKEDKNTKEVSSESLAVSMFSKAAAESTTLFLPSSKPTMGTSSNVVQDVFKFGTSSSTGASATFEFTPKPSSAALPGEVSQSSKQGGKMKSRVVDSGRSSIRHEEEVIEEPTFNPVPLLLPSLPKIDLTVSPAGQGLQTNFSSMPEGFKFSIPEIVDVQAISETLDTAPNFTFRNPTLIDEGNTSSPKASVPSPSQPQLMFNSSSSSLLVPKLKTNPKKDVTSEKLKGGSILDILKPKEKPSEKSTLTLSPNNGEKSVVANKVFSFTNSDSTKSVLEQPVNSVVKKTDTEQGVEGFGSMFKKSSDEWECSVCMLRNKSALLKCVACEALRPGQATSASQDIVGAAKSCASWGGSGSGWGDAFKKSASEWECDMCMVRNKDSVSKCVACETPKPGSKSEMKGLLDVSVDSKEKTSTIGFGPAFVKQKGEWECDTCLVRNKSDATKCISCETHKPGAANVSEAITGNFKFGVNIAVNDSTSVGSVFKFGLSNSQAEEKATSSGFNFGIGAKSTQEKGSQGSSGFKFGLPTEKPNALTVHSFGSSTETDQPKDKVASSSVGFSFGVKKADTKKEDKTEVATKPLFFCSKTCDGVESVTSTTPAFQFGSGSKTQVAFSFDSGTKDKAKEEQKSNAAGEVKSGFSEEVKPPKTNDLNFNAKTVSTEGNTTKPSFTFNSVSTSNKEDNATTTAVGSPFGVLTKKDPTPIVATTTTPSATSAPPITTPFGATSEANTTTSSNVFAFGDKASTPNAFPSFSFSTAQPPAIKEENKTSLTFSFGSKIDSSETNEPAKKLSFGSPSFAPAVNNGVSAPSSLFTFGSKENKLGSGTGFGTPPTNTPAFGAPAPSSNTTSSFQFGNGNPPARAATAPTAFGSTTPAFGSSVNSSTSGFAFGQPAEKKSSTTGFDFGQAASSAGPASFNFSATVPQSSNPGLFQFGQSQANNSSSAGVFQFGSRNSEVQAPGTAFGNNENPFTPGPPSGRVMKKAVRRARK